MQNGKKSLTKAVIDVVFLAYFPEAHLSMPGGAPDSTHEDGLRTGERAVALPPAQDAQLRFIGHIRTPWTDRRDCPRQGRADGPECRLVLDPVWCWIRSGRMRWKGSGLKGWGRSARLRCSIGSTAAAAI